KEKYEFETLEKEIENLEEEKVKLEAELAENATDFDIISKATERLGVVIAELATKGDRWLELSEFAE
ncbi:MAG TPA: ABC transporter, partial [Bacteroidetes bacterium]|nr:ABC transporter [Bacteroidota bacterium]